MPFYDCSGCNPLYTWTPYNDNSCYRIVSSAATAPLVTIPLVRTSYTDYSTYGTQFYAGSFNHDGTGTIEVLLDTSYVGGTYMGTTWANPYSVSSTGETSGPLNRCAIWYTANTIQETWLGFSACLTGITGGKTYYVGLGADNEYKLVLDGIEILNTNGGSMSSSDTFKWWHVYPVTLSEGNHTLELYGLDHGSVAGFGMEIYDNTLSGLTAATSVSSLNIIFSSSAYTFADVVQNSSNHYLSSGYTCSGGYVYSTCSGSCLSYEFCIDSFWNFSNGVSRNMLKSLGILINIYLNNFRISKIVFLNARYIILILYFFKI